MQIVISRPVSSWGIVTVLGKEAGRINEAKSKLLLLCLLNTSLYHINDLGQIFFGAVMDTGKLTGWAFELPRCSSSSIIKLRIPAKRRYIYQKE